MTIVPIELQSVVAYDLQILNRIVAGRDQVEQVFRVRVPAHVGVSSPTLRTWTGKTKGAKRITTDTPIIPTYDQHSGLLVEGDVVWKNCVHGYLLALASCLA
jgi:hypothetical protein